jgi:branched-chain amino acid transport system substrate-binding protein
MGKGKILTLLVIFVMVFALMSVHGAGGTIKLGTILPISGAVSAYGTESRDAILMAVEEINAKGGVLGKKIEMMVEDDENSPDKTMNALKKLIARDKIIGFVGAMTSKCSLAITKYDQAKKVVMITPTSTNDAVTDAGDYIFRSCYKDSFQGEVAAQFAFETLKVKKAAILYDITNDYSKGLMTNFFQKFRALGGQVMAAETYSAGDKDFNAQLTKISTAKPEVIFIPDYYNTISLIAKQVRAQGITIPLLGADGWDEITNNAGDEVLNCFYCNHYSPEANDPEVKNFVKKFESKYKSTPNALAALSYDATYILAEAIQKAGSPNPEKIKIAMMKTNRKFVTGRIKFDANRNPIKSAVMLEIVKGTDGKLTTKYAGTVNP